MPTSTHTTHRKLGLTSLQARLILLIGATTLLLVGLGFWTFQRYEAISQAERVARSGDEAYLVIHQKLRQSWAERQQLLVAIRGESLPERISQLTFRIEGLTQLSDEQLAQLIATSQALKHQPLRETERELDYQAKVFRAAQASYLSQAAQPLTERYALDQTMATALTPAYVAALRLIDQHHEQRLALAGGSQTPELIATTQYYTLVVFLLALLVLVVLPLLFFGRPIAFLRRIMQALDRLKFGEISQEKLPEPDNEVGAIAQGINTVSNNLHKAAAFANAIGQGHFDSEFSVAGTGDVLGEALVEMRDRLRDVAEDEARRNWAIAGFARFGEILRANTDLDTFTDDIIRNLTYYIRAIQGGFFLVEEQAGGGSVLRLVNSYAYERRKYLDKTFRLGEGLVGQAALEKGTILVTEIPQNYVTVTSGLGQANPSCLLVVPLVSNGELYGVLEFAAFQRFEAHVVEFVERLAENIAGTLTNVRNNERTLRLLDETQQMASKLQASEQEARRNMEELASTSAEMKRVQIELEGQIRAINFAAIVSETNIAGDIIFVNDEFCRVSQYERHELIGQNHRILKSGHQPDALFEDLWATIAAGRVFKGIIKNRAKDGTYYWVSTTITPVLDREGKPVKYIGVRFDITEQIAQEERIRQALEQSQAQEEELRQNAEEMAATQEEIQRMAIELEGQVGALNNAAIVSEADLRGDIIYVNDVFCRISKYSREELIGVNHRILKSGHQPDELFEDLWATIAAGRVFKGIIKNRAKDGSYYWVSTTITPVLDREGKPVKYVGVRFDITEQVAQEERVRQALEESQAQEEELRQNAEEMAATQEEVQRMALELKGQVGALNNAAIVSEADLRGEIIYVNDVFCRISKYSREELMGQNHRILKSGHQPDELFEDLWATIAAGRVFKGLIKNRAKDGSYYWVSTTITPVLDREGKPVKYVGVRFDITEQIAQEERIRQALEESQAQEEELRQNAEEMAATQEEVQRMALELKGQVGALNNAAIVSEADLRGEIIYVNDVFCAISKYSREELMGKNHRILKSGHQPDELFQELWATIAAGRVFKGIIKNRAKDGSYYWVSTTITPVLDREGKPVKYVGVRFDITEQVAQEERVRQALEESQAQEEELRQNAEEMAATQEEVQRMALELKGQVGALNNAAIVSEADLRGEIIYVNDVFCRISKYSREELMGQNHRILKSGHQPDELFEDLWATIAAGRVFKGLIKNRAKDGSYYWVSTTITPVLDREGKPVKYVGVRFDITEQVAQEERIRQALEQSLAQEEELRQNAEEMAATQEEVQRMALELKGQVGALNNAAIVSEADLRGEIIYVNDVFCAISKYSREELMGKNHRILKSGHQPDELFQELWATIAAGRVFKGLIKNRAKDGSYYWVSTTITPVLDREGKPVKYVGVRFDITEQVAQEERVRQALEQSLAQEEELRQNAEEMAATQEQMRRLNREMEATLRAINRTSAMFELNPTGVIVRANDNFLRSVGYVGDELIGQPYTRLVKPEEAQSIEFRRFWNRLLEGIPEKGEFALLRSDGTEAWFIATFNPLTDENERVTRILAFASDITLEKEQEAMLRQTLQQLKSQSSGHSPELVAELERTRREFEAARRELTQQLDAAKRLTAFLELNAKGFITSVNDRLLEIMGYESYEIIGLHVDDLLDGPDSTHLKELLGNGHKPVEEARLKLKSKTGTLTQWSGWYQFSETDAGELSRVRLFLSLYE